MSQYADAGFSLKERGPYPPGHWWIEVETEGMPILDAGYLGLIFRENVDRQTAQQVVELLRRHVVGISYNEL